MEAGPNKNDTPIGEFDIPKGSYINTVVQTKVGEGGCDKWTTSIEFEEAWTTEEFIAKSEQVDMPWRKQPSIPDRTLKNIVDALERGVDAYEDKWDRNIQIMAKRASRYKGQERDAREATPEYIKKVAGKKRTKFMGDLLKERK